MRQSRLLLIISTVLLGSAVGIAAGPGDDEACDLKTVVPGFYCEACDQALLGKDLVSDVTYYACPDCGDTSREAGRCSWCEVDLVKKTSGKGVCAGCLEKPAAAEVCEKVYYTCPDCGATAMVPGNCAECEQPMTKQLSRAAVYYMCPECGAHELKPGKCTNASCENKGKDLKRACSMSGEFPHGGSE